MSTTVTCPSCKGSGKGPRGPYSPRDPICLDCDGMGEVEIGADGERVYDDGPSCRIYVEPMPLPTRMRAEPRRSIA